MTDTNEMGADGESRDGVIIAREPDRTTTHYLARDQFDKAGKSAHRIAKDILMSLLRCGFGKLDYAASRPGTPERTNGPEITVRRSVRYWPSVALFRPTVWMKDGCNLWQLAYFRVSRRWTIRRSEALHPGVDSTQYEQWGIDEMRAAIETAKFVALSYLGYNVKQYGEGALVVSAGRGPARGILHRRDVIVEVGGEKVNSTEDLMRLLHSATKGAEVELTVEPVNPRETPLKKVVVRLATEPPLLGATVRTHNLFYNFPVDIEISAEGAGSSGSLAMALGIIDVLGEKDLCAVPTAATGVLRKDGVIGEVAGISQKARSLRRSEVRRFLVPRGAGEEARAATAGDFEVIEVANLKEALDALALPQLLGPK
jgi:PDZ domain-containing secreted protein